MKVTKFFVKISQFEFAIMTEKKNKLFLLLNISDFSLFFYVKTETPLKKVIPQKIEILLALLFENLVGRSINLQLIQ